MKIGILNMQYSRHNYGALLQAAALEQAVRDILPSATVEHIDSRPNWMCEPKGFARLKAVFRKYVGSILRRPSQLPRLGNYDVFSDFRSKYLTLSQKTYYNAVDYDREQWDYDLVIVGSDQVFRYEFVKDFAGIFFLGFLPEPCRRVAYAASFGVDQWEGADDSGLTEEVAGDLAKFDAISVREASGVDICRDTFGLEAQHVLDPTLLVGRQYFDDIIDRYAPSVSNGDWSLHCISKDAKCIDAVPKLAKYHGKELRNIYFERKIRWPLPVSAHFSSVPEWLGQIRDTKELVLTDSFHGVCFSILFERNFLVFISEERGRGRITSLLKLLGLEDRICLNIETFQAAVVDQVGIDYVIVRQKIKEERERSFFFLRRALDVSVSLDSKSS